MTEITVELFTPECFQAICDIHNQSYKYWIENLGDTYGYHSVTADDVQSWVTTSSNFIAIAFIEKSPVGYTHYSIEELSGDNSIKNLVFVETKESLGQSKLAVLPTFRRLGVAQALIEFTCNHAVELGAETAMIFTYNTNKPLKGLLSKLGFNHFKFQYYERYSNDNPICMDSVLAELDLTSTLPNVPQNEQVLIRNIDEKDLEGMRTVFGECRPDVFGPAPTLEQILGWFHAKWAVETLVAEMDGKIIGCMEYTSAGIVGIPGVLNEYRGSGIGSTLFFQLLRSMQKRGMATVIADTGFIMEEAIRMYKRFGFSLNRELWSWLKIL